MTKVWILLKFGFRIKSKLSDLFSHAKASHWIEDGLSIVEVQFLLGHEQIETTMKYLDITTAEKVKALATLENEKEKKVEKKWKNSGASSLTRFCGLNRK